MKDVGGFAGLVGHSSSGKSNIAMTMAAKHSGPIVYFDIEASGAIYEYKTFKNPNRFFRAHARADDQRQWWKRFFG